MKRLIPLLLAASLVGCQAQDVSSAGTSAPTTSASDDKGNDVPAPKLNDIDEARLSLRVWGHDVRVGDSVDSANDVFPDTRRAIESSDLPPRFSKPFVARAWEKGDDGFGVIAYRGAVCAAFASFDKLDDERLAQILEAQPARWSLGSPAVNASHSRYWFDEQGSVRLMVCAFQDPRDGMKVTAAIGTTEVMDALGASPKAAETDANHAEEFLRQNSTSIAGTPKK